MDEPRRLSEVSAQVADDIDLPDGPLVVALSGGADSAALLYMCRRLGREVRALHVHHGLAASDVMAGAAVAIAEALITDLEVIEVEVPAGASPEDQARRVRYAALDAAVRPGEWIVTAHTSDDQAETVIDHLLRASGPDGLRGIPARRPPHARPLLAVSRSVTRELATLAGLPWVDDPVNATLDPLRNRIRLQLIPYLEATYNRRLRQALATTARLVATDVEHLEAALRPDITVTQGGAAMAASVLVTAGPSPAARMARRLLAAAGLAAASPIAVAGVLAVAAGEMEGSEPGGGLSVRRRGALVVVETAADEPPQRVELAVPGTTRFGAWLFDAQVVDRPPPAMPLGSAWMVADADSSPGWAVEAARTHPEALERLAAAGVPAPDRPSHPVLVGGHRPVWVPMVRRLDFGWADAATARYLVVRTRLDRECHRYAP